VHINPNHRGAVAETAIALEAIKAGVEVYKPLSEHARADLIFGVGARLFRVQCKSAVRNGEVIVIRFVSSWHAPGGYVRNKYSADEIDLVAAYCHDLDRAYLLPIELVVGRSGIHLRLAAPRNAQRASIHSSSDFEFQGAVAQLGERPPGRRKATGSSPVSSTSCEPVGAIGANDFRRLFGWYAERAAAGEEFLITRRGKPYVRLTPAQPQLRVAPLPKPG
jgi:prevent-host-death family protein